MAAYPQGKITEAIALLYCTTRGPVTRAIDTLRKARGESTTDVSGLRMRGLAEKPQDAPPVATKVKIK